MKKNFILTTILITSMIFSGCSVSKETEKIDGSLNFENYTKVIDLTNATVSIENNKMETLMSGNNEVVLSPIVVPDVDGVSIVVLSKNIDKMNENDLLDYVKKQQESISSNYVYVLKDVNEINPYEFYISNYADNIVLVYSQNKEIVSSTDIEEISNLIDLNESKKDEYVEVVKNIESEIMSFDIAESNDFKSELNGTLSTIALTENNQLAFYFDIKNDKNYNISNVAISGNLYDVEGILITDYNVMYNINLAPGEVLEFIVYVDSFVMGKSVNGFEIKSIDFEKSIETKNPLTIKKGKIIEGVEIKEYKTTYLSEEEVKLDVTLESSNPVDGTLILSVDRIDGNGNILETNEFNIGDLTKFNNLNVTLSELKSETKLLVLNVYVLSNSK